MSLEIDTYDWSMSLRRVFQKRDISIGTNDSRTLLRALTYVFCESSGSQPYTSVATEEVAARWYKSQLFKRRRFGRGKGILVDVDVLEEIVEDCLNIIHDDLTDNGVQLPYNGVMIPRYLTKDILSIGFIDEWTLEQLRSLGCLGTQVKLESKYERAYNVLTVMEKFKTWVEEEDQSRLRPISNEVFELVDQFTNNAGWM